MKLIRKFYDIRQGEWGISMIMFFINFLLMNVLYFSKPARDSLFLTELGAQRLPLVFILIAVISVPVTLLVSNAVREHSNHRVFLWSNVTAVACFAGIRALFVLEQGWVYTLFYVWVALYSIMVISQFWVYANELYDTSAAKRIFPFLNLGAILGAICGSQLSSVSVSIIATEDLLYACIVFLMLILVLVHRLKGIRGREETGVRQRESATSTLQNLKQVLGSKYQLLILAITGMAVFVSTLVDYQLKSVASDAYVGSEALTAFLGRFYAGVSISALLIQVLFSTVILKGLGLGGALMTRPFGMLVGTVLMVIEPVLGVAVFLSGFDSAAQNSIDKTGREILFLPLAQNIKERTKFFLDVFVDRFFRGLSGVVLVLMVLVLGLGVQAIAYLVGFLLIAWLGFGWMAHREYIKQFRRSINQRYIELGSAELNLHEPQTQEMIRESLKAGDPNRVHAILRLLHGFSVKPFGEELRALLYHNSSAIRLEALKLLTTIPDRNYTDEVARFLNEQDPEIRLESVYYTCMHAEGDPREILIEYLNSNSFDRQAAAIGCIAKYGRSQEQGMISDEMVESIISAKGEETSLAKVQVARMFQHADGAKAEQYLPTLLGDEEPVVRKEAIKVMGVVKRAAFVPLLVRRLNDPQHARHARESLSGYGSSYVELIASYWDGADPETRVQIPKVLGTMVCQRSVDELMSILNGVTGLKKCLYPIKALNKLRRANEGLHFYPERIRAHLEQVFGFYYTYLSAFYYLPAEERYSLLRKVLNERMDLVSESIFRLLGLIHDPRDMYGAYLGIRSVSKTVRGDTAEFLENILDADLKKDMLPIIDPIFIEAGMKHGKKRFVTGVDSYNEGMLTLMDMDDPWLNACAIHAVSERDPEELRDRVKKAVNDEEKVVRETATRMLEANP